MILTIYQGALSLIHTLTYKSHMLLPLLPPTVSLTPLLSAKMRIRGAEGWVVSQENYF